MCLQRHGQIFWEKENRRASVQDNRLSRPAIALFARRINRFKALKFTRRKIQSSDEELLTINLIQDTGHTDAGLKQSLVNNLFIVIPVFITESHIVG